jgi:subtilisin family serine protease
MRRLRFGAARAACFCIVKCGGVSALAFAIGSVLLVERPAEGAEPAGAGTSPNGAALVKLMGDKALRTFAPGSQRIAGLVALPGGAGARAADLGLEAVAPGIARFRGSVDALTQFGIAHPGLAVEVSPPLHTLLDRAGAWIRAPRARVEKGVDGTGTLVGIADTGLDVTHPDLVDENGKSRVAWFLDLSLKPYGKYPDLEDAYGVKDENGTLVSGAVLSGEDIDAIVLSKAPVPTDEVGHGTHVTSLAVGNGGRTGAPSPRYEGIATKAQIVFARVTRTGSDAIENDDLLRGTAFMFERATAMKLPIAVNLSIGTDFGPHDGTTLWEKTLASFVGPEQPGRALVVAAGNSGSIAESPVHQNVHVVRGSLMRVPIATKGARSGALQVWASVRKGADLKIGLEGPDGEWIPPVAEGEQRGKNASNGAYNAGVVFGSKLPKSPIPEGSRGAVILWSGAWPSGTYNITFDGVGTVDLFFQATGDALGPHVGFLAGVREGTINLPGTHPGILAVGCTLNHPTWKSIVGGKVSLHAPMLDTMSGLPLGGGASRDVGEGEVCWFSSTGPNVNGVPKPEISAPGGGVIGALSKQANPRSPSSIFSQYGCPAEGSGPAGASPCLQIDDTHGVAVGTSMSAPLVAGTIALLFQRDPTLTQDRVVALLQAGAHAFKGTEPYNDLGGPGELDVLGALDALEAMSDPKLGLPDRNQSWITLASTYASADGSMPVTAILELRTADGEHRADLFDPTRLRAFATIGRDDRIFPSLIRKAPGLYYFVLDIPKGRGGSTMTVGATFDGVDIVTPKSAPIATDAWTADYPSKASGSNCAASPAHFGKPGYGSFALGAFGALFGTYGFRRARRRRSPNAMRATRVPAKLKGVFRNIFL